MNLLKRLSASAAAAGLFLLPALAGHGAGTRPNIVFIMSDDHAWQAVSAYGEARHLIQTPNIDRLAREGLRFDRCLVNNALCGPSRASIITGTYSHINGFYNNANCRFDGTQTTFPGHTLWATNSAANDYSTVAFTFKLLAGPTNLGLTLSSNGVITWPVPAAEPAGSFTNIVQATYTGTPSLTGTNSFVIIVLTNLPSPVLMVPAAQTLYGGQNLNVSVSATNTTFPSHTYLYQTNAATPAGVVLNSTNGRLTWLPANAQRGNTYTLSIRATDQQASQLSATNSFIVTVKLDALQPATFTAPPQIVSATNGFQFTLNTQPSLTWRIDASTNLSLWQPLFTNQTGPGTTLQLTDLLATNYLRRFYRAALQ